MHIEYRQNGEYVTEVTLVGHLKKFPLGQLHYDPDHDLYRANDNPCVFWRLFPEAVEGTVQRHFGPEFTERVDIVPAGLDRTMLERLKEVAHSVTGV